MYDEGDDASKGVYVAKLEELRAMAGPVVQRHFEKVEAERRAVQERVEAEKLPKEPLRKRLARLLRPRRQPREATRR